ncbi:hypothetical protein EVAR_88979_1 [Eumeta japonica]|uniref:Mos1 transposase HTH domain-containing protein n=1 Tax=Eumeta variegata TaxID=151549 RepID=A0A4C1VP80_EUMVA|nr:hypothetical protein EVAR_88979_1 [Eumeta japonica]
MKVLQNRLSVGERYSVEAKSATRESTPVRSSLRNATGDVLSYGKKLQKKKRTASTPRCRIASSVLQVGLQHRRRAVAAGNVDSRCCHCYGARTSFQNFRRGLCSDERLPMLVSIYDVEATSQTTIYRWYAEFRRDCASLSTVPTGRPGKSNPKRRDAHRPPEDSDRAAGTRERCKRTNTARLVQAPRPGYFGACLHYKLERALNASPFSLRLIPIIFRPK